MLSQQSPRLFLLFMKRRTTSTCNTCCESSMLIAPTQTMATICQKDLHTREQKRFIYTLPQKSFLVSVGNIFQVSARSTDTICRIQKIIHSLCRLLLADTTNRFFKIKKSEAVTVEPKEGIKEGGRTVGWVIIEVVRATGWVMPPGAPDLDPTPRLGAVAVAT
jgi:hypothetical protein